MKKYIVIALVVSGSGNLVFKAGDEVNENQFPQGRADELVKSGFLQLKEESKEEKKPAAKKVEEPEKDK